MSLPVPTSMKDREIADALWRALEEIGLVDGKGGSEYRSRLLGQTDNEARSARNLQEGPGSRVAEWAEAGRVFLRGLAS